MHPAIPIFLVFAGCCSNVIFLEFLVKEFPGSGNIVTFGQFLFISIEGFINTTNFGRKKPVIPLSTYLIMVSLFFVVQVVNNYALNFNISMPLHMIFRSGSLIANLILGVIIMKKRYKMSKYLSVMMISAGIVLCTLVSAGQPSSNPGASEEEGAAEFARWLIGIGMLTFALFMSARMGIYQEQIYSKYGKHPNEALFYNHALPLPGFLLLATDIYNQVLTFNQTTPVVMPLVAVSIPKVWLFFIGNVITQYICIKGVFILTTECASLTVTLVVTLRKFVSLLFSIWYFQNPFTFYHWIGTALVFGGTLVFTETFTLVKNMLFPDKKKTS